MHIKPATTMLGLPLDPPQLALSQRERRVLEQAIVIARQARALCNSTGVAQVESDADMLLAWAAIGPEELLEYAA